MSCPVTIALPVPPSANRMYANIGKRRIKTKAARRWARDAAWAIKIAAGGRKITGPWSIGGQLPRAMKGDCDNRLKAILDAAAASGIVIDDRHCAGITVERTGETSEAIVTLRAAS